MSIKDMTDAEMIRIYDVMLKIQGLVPGWWKQWVARAWQTGWRGHISESEAATLRLARNNLGPSWLNRTSAPAMRRELDKLKEKSRDQS